MALTCSRIRRQNRCRRGCFRRCKRPFARCYHTMIHRCYHTLIHFLDHLAGSPSSPLTDVGLWPGFKIGQHPQPTELTRMIKMVIMVKHQKWARNIIDTINDSWGDLPEQGLVLRRRRWCCFSCWRKANEEKQHWRKENEEKNANWF